MHYGKEPRVNEAQMAEFLNLSLSRAGAEQMITPREMLRDYMTILNILMQNETISFEEVIRGSMNEPGGTETAQEPTQQATAAPARYTAQDIEF